MNTNRVGDSVGLSASTWSAVTATGGWKGGNTTKKDEKKN